MPTAATRVVLTVTAFAPLWLALAILETPGAGWATLPMYLLAAISPIALRTFLRAGIGDVSHEVAAVRTTRREHDILSYVATYIVPFALVGSNGWRSTVALTMFLCVILFLSIHSRLFYINPLLAVAGYHIHEVEQSNGSSITLISKRVRIGRCEKLRVRTLTEDVYVEVPR